MGLLSRLFAGELRATWDPFDDRWYQPIGGVMTPAGMRVDEDGAQKLSAWYRGKFILQVVLAMLPFPILQRLPNDGGSEPAVDHPLYDVVHDQPNDADDSFQWRCTKMGHLIDHGHAYDWIVPGTRGFVHQLVPITPTLVTPKQQVVTLANGAVIPGRMLYDVRDAKTGRTSTFTQDEIFHLRTPDGQGVLAHARASLGTALAIEQYAGTTFGRGSLHGGIIETPGPLDPEASARMAKSFVTAAGDWRLPKVLEQGATFKPNDMSPEDFQMLLSRKFSVDDIARWLGVSRQLLENSDPSFGNAEQFWQSFLTIGMGGWLSLFEFAVNSQLILAPKKYYARFTRQAISRADLAARWNAHVASVNAGIVTVDEVRGVEDLNKRGGKADELREPQNITGKPAAADPAIADNSTPAPSQKNTPPAAAAASDDRVRAIVIASAARLQRKEILAGQKAAVKYAADPAGFAASTTAFYDGHQPLVMQTLQLADALAQLYCDTQRDDLIAHGLVATEEWTTDYLVGLALDLPRPDPWQTHADTLAKQSHTITVHGGPTTIAKGALHAPIDARTTVTAAPVTVHPAEVTFAKGAIQHDAHLTVPTLATAVVDRVVRRNAKGQTVGVRETHTTAASGAAPARAVVVDKTVTYDQVGQIARVRETRVPTEEEGE